VQETPSLLPKFERRQVCGRLSPSGALGGALSFSPPLPSPTQREVLIVELVLFFSSSSPLLLEITRLAIRRRREFVVRPLFFLFFSSEGE